MSLRMLIIISENASGPVLRNSLPAFYNITRDTIGYTISHSDNMYNVCLNYT